MTTNQKAQYLTRSEILEALSDDEVKAVANAETADSLRDGEAYLDLTHLEQGVRHAGKGSAVRVGRVLPKSAIHDGTWRKIVALLPQAQSPAAIRS